MLVSVVFATRSGRTHPYPSIMMSWGLCTILSKLSISLAFSPLVGTLFPARSIDRQDKLVIWKTSSMQDSHDWMIDANGFYVATRLFLIRRGFCCANQCRNCPYINWRNSSTWKPLSAEAVRVMAVSPKAIEGARKALMYHEE